MGDELQKFYNDLQTVPKLIRDLALSVAEAQRALDHDYLQNLTEFLRLIRALPADGKSLSVEETKALFQLMAPSRHQFTETVCEVRADIQMASASELGLTTSMGLKGALFSVAVNASYLRRNAYNAQAAATIKTVIHSVPADPGVLEKLIARAAAIPSVEGPKETRWQEISEAFAKLFGELRAAPASPSTTPAAPAANPEPTPPATPPNA